MVETSELKCFILVNCFSFFVKMLEFIVFFYIKIVLNTKIPDLKVICVLDLVLLSKRKNIAVSVHELRINLNFLKFNAIYSISLIPSLVFVYVFY